MSLKKKTSLECVIKKTSTIFRIWQLTTSISFSSDCYSACKKCEHYQMWYLFWIYKAIINDKEVSKLIQIKKNHECYKDIFFAECFSMEEQYQHRCQ